jgi:ribosome-associated toxin RatA of RatAB toxin-antitoxin module
VCFRCVCVCVRERERREWHRERRKNGQNDKSIATLHLMSLCNRIFPSFHGSLSHTMTNTYTHHTYTHTHIYIYPYTHTPSPLQVNASDSPLFHHLHNSWRFEPGPVPSSCVVHFAVDFAFRSSMHSSVVDLFFAQVVQQLVSAFEGQCARVYGRRPSIPTGHPLAPRHKSDTLK